jgi:DNA-binding NtrC family response regulator
MEPEGFGRTLAEIERRHILSTLTSCHGNRTRAARILNISIRGLRLKLRDYVQSGCKVCDPIRSKDDLRKHDLRKDDLPFIL